MQLRKILTGIIVALSVVLLGLIAFVFVKTEAIRQAQKKALTAQTIHPKTGDACQLSDKYKGEKYVFSQLNIAVCLPNGWEFMASGASSNASSSLVSTAWTYDAAAHPVVTEQTGGLDGVTAPSVSINPLSASTAPTPQTSTLSAGQSTGSVHEQTVTTSDIALAREYGVGAGLFDAYFTTSTHSILFSTVTKLGAEDYRDITRLMAQSLETW